MVDEQLIEEDEDLDKQVVILLKESGLSRYTYEDDMVRAQALQIVKSDKISPNNSHTDLLAKQSKSFKNPEIDDSEFKQISTLLLSMQDPRFQGQYGQSQYSTEYHNGGNLPLFERVKTAQTGDANLRKQASSYGGGDGVLFKTPNNQMKDLQSNLYSYQTHHTSNQISHG